MANWNRYINKAGLTALYYTGLAKLASGATRGRGLIFTIHQVGETNPNPFSPNAILKITPKFLDETIQLVKALQFDILSLDDLPARLSDQQNQKPFVIFTLDDGYRDNRDAALPIFEKHNVPHIIYIVSDYSTHEGELWWLDLEEIIKHNRVIKDPFIPGKTRKATTPGQKHSTFEQLYWQLRQLAPLKQREMMRQLAAGHDYDLTHLTRELIMSWQELKELQTHPLVTLGAHTKSHFSIAQMDRESATTEIVRGMEAHTAALGSTPKHFAFPYGDRTSAGEREFVMLKELGLQTAVTTRKGMLFDQHLAHLTALPRVSLNGKYQNPLYVKTFLTGLPFFIANGMKHLTLDGNESVTSR